MNADVNTSADLDPFPPDLYPIRLDGPWEWRPCGSGSKSRVKLPGGWDTIRRAEQNSFSLSRRFHKPTNLDPEERVLVLLPSWCMPSEMALNDRNLPLRKRVSDWRVVDLTTKLRQANLLNLTFLSSSQIPNSNADSILLGIMPDADGSWWASLEDA